jgi:hypothetical protein
VAPVTVLSNPVIFDTRLLTILPMAAVLGPLTCVHELLLTEVVDPACAVPVNVAEFVGRVNVCPAPALTTGGVAPPFSLAGIVVSPCRNIHCHTFIAWGCPTISEILEFVGIVHVVLG